VVNTGKPEAFATCTDRIGWHGGAFVLPLMTIGDDAERVVFQSENQMENRCFGFTYGSGNGWNPFSV
jgi:putative DNA primase/helicase